MFDNRKRVLEMLDSKKINVDEAMKLLNAMEDSGKTATATKTAGLGSIKYLRVTVDSPEGHHGRGPAHVNIRVPISLIRAGIKFRSLIPHDAGDHVEAALKQKGIDFDLKSLKDEDVDELVQALRDVEIDIDENGHHGKVKIVAE